jgi:hypothetical protein
MKKSSLALPPIEIICFFKDFPTNPPITHERRNSIQLPIQRTSSIENEDETSKQIKH